MAKKCWVRGLRFSGLFRSVLTEALSRNVDGKLRMNAVKHAVRAEVSNVRWREPKIMQPSGSIKRRQFPE
jgi:hypothetical protein